MRLKDKVALITGGARGIGKASALLFAREGAKVVIADFDGLYGQLLADEIRSAGLEGTFIQVDVTDRDSVARLAQQAIAIYGRVDILVNNAGITDDALMAKMSYEQWDKVIAVNLTGVFNVTREILPYMLEQGSGNIINTSSVVGVYGNVGQTNYAATKFGVVGLTKTWAKELGSKGIRVNAVAPGFIATEMTAKVPEKVLDAVRNKTPLRKLGEPEDIAYAYLYLASEESKYVNGVVLQVDGGLVL